MTAFPFLLRKDISQVVCLLGNDVNVIFDMNCTMLDSKVWALHSFIDKSARSEMSWQTELKKHRIHTHTYICICVWFPTMQPVSVFHCRGLCLLPHLSCQWSRFSVRNLDSHAYPHYFLLRAPHSLRRQSVLVWNIKYLGRLISRYDQTLSFIVTCLGAVDHCLFAVDKFLVLPPVIASFQTWSLCEPAAWKVLIKPFLAPVLLHLPHSLTSLPMRSLDCRPLVWRLKKSFSHTFFFQNKLSH